MDTLGMGMETFAASRAAIALAYCLGATFLVVIATCSIAAIVASLVEVIDDYRKNGR